MPRTLAAVAAIAIFCLLGCQTETPAPSPSQPAAPPVAAPAPAAPPPPATGAPATAPEKAPQPTETAKPAAPAAMEAVKPAASPAPAEPVKPAAAEAVKPAAAPSPAEAVKPAAAAPAKPPAVADTVVLQASQGQVTLPHLAHAKLFPCATCHGESTPGKIGLTKDTAHALCRDCHKAKGAGPTACGGCHQK